MIIEWWRCIARGGNEWIIGGGGKEWIIDYFGW